MIKFKKLMASVLLCAAMLSMVFPVGAANSSFSDVHDDTTALNADVLRLMGVVSGSGNNSFSPNSNLTRAQFCVMAVNVMGRSDDVPIHTTRTIFTDVTSRHWARGYVNLAASITVGGSSAEQSGSRLISGVGTGEFKPDDQITFAQAVTILMRMLGYGDDTVGAVWPAGYLNLAASLHLTDGITAAPSAPITRAQAAQLFVNLLSTKTNGGQEYYTTLGSATKDVMLLAVGVDGDDGVPGAIRTSKGTYQPAAQGVVPTALQGRRGVLVVNEKNELLAFVPDGSTAVTVTLSGAAQATYIKTSGGVKYSINATTPAFTSAADSSASTWADLWVDLPNGCQVTLFLDGGKVIGVYYAAGGLSAEEAYVVTGSVDRTDLHALTGGADNYTIQKDQETISLSDIQRYDVLTYDALTNTLIVSDLRLTCVYEKASPNPTTPETITVLGHDFPVLDSALDSIGQFDLGQTVCLLLTADGQVAGMTKPGSGAGSTATGLAGSDSVLVDLPNGQTIKLTGAVDDKLQDQVVTVSGGKNGKLNVSSISTSSIPGDFSVSNMTLGSTRVAAGAKLYEQIRSGAMIPLDLADLDADTVSKNHLAAFHRNTSGMVDILVLEETTGDAYTYGMLKKGTTETSTGDFSASYATISVVNGSGTSAAMIGGSTAANGSFGGVVAGARENSGTKLAAGTISLTEIRGVKRSDYFQQDGTWYVRANGTVYPVADQVEGYIKATSTWFTQSTGRLEAIRAYSDDMTVYVDPVGGKVRVIVCY